MQFIVNGYDGADPLAPQRRSDARADHLEMLSRQIELGHGLYACALLDDQGNMVGSMLVMDFPSQVELDAWLQQEPYVLQGVWEKVEIKPCKVAPAFAK